MCVELRVASQRFESWKVSCSVAERLELQDNTDNDAISNERDDAC